MTCPWKSINSNVWEAEAGESFEMKVYTWSKEHSSMAMRESLSKKKNKKLFVTSTSHGTCLRICFYLLICRIEYQILYNRV